MNRYTQLSQSNLNDLPLLQLPFEALNNVVLKAQQSKDEFEQLSGLTPKYLQQSESDRKLAASVQGYQSQLAQNLTELAASGNTSEYRRQLGQAKRAIVDMWKPGGAAHALEQRHAGWEAEKKRIEDAMKDNPIVAQALTQGYKFNDIGYNPNQRTYNPLGQSVFVRDVPEKEINEWFDRNQGNIKDSLLNEGYSKKALEGVNTLHDFWQIKGVPFNRLVDTFLNLFPEEYTQSIFQREAAYRFFDPSRPTPETSVFQTTTDKQGNVVRKTDSKGNYVLNTNNPIAKLIQGQALLGERRDISHDRKIVKDDIALERAKLRLKREDEEAQYVPRATQEFNMPGGGIKPLDLNLDKNGLITVPSTPSGLRYNISDLDGSKIHSTQFASKYGVNVKAIDLFRDGTIAKEIPEAKQVYDKYKNETWFKNLDDKKKAEVLIEATNQAAALTRTTSLTANFPEGDNAKKEIENKTFRIVGKGEALGDIQNRPVYTITNGTVSSEPMSVNRIIDEHFGGDRKKFIESARFKSDIRGDNALMPSGDFIQVTIPPKKGFLGMGKEGTKTITLLATEDNTIQAAIRAPLYMGNAVRYGSKDLSYPFETGVTLPNGTKLDGEGGLYPMGLQTQRRTIYKDDDYRQQAENVLSSYETNGFYLNPQTGERVTNKLAVQAIADQYRKEADRLKRSPKENTARFEVNVLDYATGQQIGDDAFWRDITRSLESEAIKYER
jgi:hypothetical protein